VLCRSLFAKTFQKICGEDRKTIDKNNFARLSGRENNAGKFDRPWFEREIFGTIRYMSGASTGKKFDSRLYMALVANPEMAKEQLFSAARRIWEGTPSPSSIPLIACKQLNP